MILVDSSVWIDFFRNQPTAQAEWLDKNLGTEGLLVGDLNEARRLLGKLEQVNLCGEGLAVEAARNCRKLRSKGVTVRGTVDVIIATRCLVDGFRLLHSDRDFDGFEQHLGLQVVAWGA